MGTFVIGDVVVVKFPLSDLKSYKLRPALVVAEAEFGDLILCQMTSQAYTSHLAVKISEKDFISGTLPTSSFARPDKLFTADVGLIVKRVAKLHIRTQKTVSERIQRLFSITEE